MQKHHRFVFLLGMGCLAAQASLAQDVAETNFTGRWSFRPQAAFNLTATFRNVGTLALNPASRSTPNGNPYNYINGYVLKDVSGNAGGQTWYWGYDSSSQIVGNTIQMSRSTTQANNNIMAGNDYHDASFGGELLYSRPFAVWDGVHFGWEAAGNYMYISLSDSTPLQADVTSTTDAYAFANGNTPPAAPYQGTFNGPGYVIASTPVSSTATVSPGAATITGNRRLSAHVVGLRLGPYVEFPMADQVNLSISAGVATAVVYASSSWSETVTLLGGGSASGSGSGQNLDMLFGGYASATLSWQFAKRWSAEVGAEYQDLGYYNHDLGGRSVQLDLHRSIVVSLGAGFSF